MKFLTGIFVLVIGYALVYFLGGGFQSIWDQSLNAIHRETSTTLINQLDYATPTPIYCGSILRTAVQNSDVNVPDKTPLSDCLYAAKNRFVGAHDLVCGNEHKEKNCNLPTDEYNKLWNTLMDEECTCWNENPLTYPTPTNTPVLQQSRSVFVCYDPIAEQAAPCIHVANGICMDTENSQVFPCSNASR